MCFWHCASVHSLCVTSSFAQSLNRFFGPCLAETFTSACCFSRCPSSFNRMAAPAETSFNSLLHADSDCHLSDSDADVTAWLLFLGVISKNSSWTILVPIKSCDPALASLRASSAARYIPSLLEIKAFGHPTVRAIFRSILRGLHL